MKKLLLILLLFLSFNSSSYADFESWFIASNTCQKINNLEEGAQKETILTNLEVLANQGEAKASSCLGALYDDGVITRDAKKSFNWYLKAAEQGHPSASRIVGLKYQQGEGVIKNYDKALYWFKKGAELGDYLAINNLVIMYEYGVEGVPKNYKEAIFWAKLAVELGQNTYKEKLNKLELLVNTKDEEVKKVKESLKLEIERTYQDNLIIQQRLINESLQLKSDLDLSIYQMDLLKDIWEAKEALARDEINQLKQSSLADDIVVPNLRENNTKLDIKLSSSIKVTNQIQQNILLLNSELESLYAEEKRLIENHTNILESIYFDNIIASVKSNWKYFGTKEGWGCDVKLIQDKNGSVQEVDIDNCTIDETYKETLFKDSIKRAVKEASPLPLTPAGIEFNQEILFKFSVN